MAADELIISFRFPPITDISGIVVGKRIIENKNQVDVLYNNIDNFNAINVNLADEYIDERLEVSIDLPRDSVRLIFRFIDEGLEILKSRQVYKSIYSRSWFMANHFLAAEYKFIHPETFWRAEFSDPVYLDINTGRGKKDKKSRLDNQEYIDKLNSAIEQYNRNNDIHFKALENPNNTYFTAEYLTMIFADELIFTNPNQRKVMLESYDEEFRNMVMNKSVIMPHPTPDGELYHMTESSVELNDDDINIAYFGSFYYPARHFEPLFYAFESLNHKYKDKIKFHLYINQSGVLKNLTKDLSFKDNIIIKKPLEYLEFLNATTKYDVLLINDTITENIFTVNPYLPSKLSDYLGSGRDIWAISEEGSVLSQTDVKYSSSMTDYVQSGDVLVRILEDYGYGDENCSFDEHFYEKRITDLNRVIKDDYDEKNRLRRSNRKLKKEIKSLKAELEEKEKSSSKRSWNPFKRSKG